MDEKELLENLDQDKILIISQTGKLKAITPELSTYFDEDMVILEKWIPKTNFSHLL
jgi:topoisomerase-4 subunit A